MESHIKGSRGSNAFGSIVSAISCGAKFGDAALNAVEIFRTDGAGSGAGYMNIQPTYPGEVGGLQPSLVPGTPLVPKKFPLFVRFFGNIITAFDGTSPAFTLTETNLDDSGSVVIANIASFAGGKFDTYKTLTVDKKYKLTYTPATGAPTAGEAYYHIWLVGPGIMRPTIPSVAQTIGP